MSKRLIFGALFALTTAVTPMAGAFAQGTGGSAPPSPTDSQQGDPTVQGGAPSGVNAGAGGAASEATSQTAVIVIGTALFGVAALAAGQRGLAYARSAR